MCSKLGKKRHLSGPDNPLWKGTYISKHGYVFVRCDNHPRANSWGFVFEHILVAEKALGKPLPIGSVIHHVNKDKSDNRPQNLVICQDDIYHRVLHMRSGGRGPHSEEHKRKIGEAQRGKQVSKETREKLSLSHKGHWRIKRSL
jgi:hypothetical protein